MIKRSSENTNSNANIWHITELFSPLQTAIKTNLMRPQISDPQTTE
jgi:hypothetical protein